MIDDGLAYMDELPLPDVPVVRRKLPARLSRKAYASRNARNPARTSAKPEKIAMQHRKEPAAAHQALMTELRGVVGRFDAQGMPGVERIAILAQLIGQEIHDLPAGLPFGAPEILHSVAANIEQGNRTASGGNASGLLGFGGRV